MAADETFKTFQAAYPYVLRKLLSDNSLATRRLLNQVSFIISFRTVCRTSLWGWYRTRSLPLGPYCLQSQSWTNITMLCYLPHGLGCILYLRWMRVWDCINVITNTNQFSYTGNFQQKERVPMAKDFRICKISFSKVCFMVLIVY